MAQFVAYKNPNSRTKKLFPYLLDIQSNLLDDIRTTIVIPLSPESLSGNAAISKLCPKIDIEGKVFVAMTQQIAGVDRSTLGKEAYDLSTYRSEIIAALDFIVSGI
ncbi:plasmid maintenance protein CcdB [Ketobacter sp. MCCC 1A13808]|uniref:CcdB family protein n=1 Tax=Ketobacter sp. MCCC 1A13808 TaxID=2602738 RepID=UPI001320FB56|nr:CcdB family protein [Ketobacter sp. MCCC 1A13808]MVF12287.1 plasmid maintenance protein CcdB [Ketobacter sp. MCCC 1A13808]